MANTFKIKVAGETHEFEQSLGNLNSGLKMLKSEARSLNKSLKVDPQNTDAARKLYDNLTQQLELTHKKAEEVKKSLANIDPKVDLKGFVSAQNQLRNLQTESKKLESTLSTIASKPHKLNLHLPRLDVQRVIGPMLSSIQSSAHAVGNAVLAPIKNSAHAVGDALLSSIQNSAHAVGAALSGAIESGLSGAKSIAISAGHGIAKGLTASLSSVRGLISGITPAISSIKNSAHNVGSAFSEAIKSGLSGAKAAAISAGHSIAKGLTAPLSQVSKRLNEVVIGGLRQIGASAVSKAGDAFSNITKSMQDTQTATNGLKKVMQFRGIAAQFDDLRKSLSQTAINTNIDTKTAEKFGSVLIGVGKQASETAKIVDAAANANQAFGGSGEAFESVSLALGQIEAAGKVTADNINQITDANSALGAALKSQVFENYQKAGGAAKSFNDAMSKGEITTDDLTNALIELSSKGGKAVQTLPDAFASLEETIGTKLQPVFDALSKALIPVVNHVTDLVQSMDFTSVAEKISSINFMQIFAGIGDAITPVITLVNRLKSAIARAFTEMTGKPATLGNAFSVMGSMISAAVNPISNLFSFLLGQAEKLQNALSQAFSNVDSSTVVGTFNAIGSAMGSVIDTTTTGLANAIQSININAILEGVKSFVQIFAQTFKQLVDTITPVAAQLGSALSQAFSTLSTGQLQSSFNSIVTGALNAFQTLGGIVADTVSQIDLSPFIDTFKNLGDTIGMLSQSISDSGIGKVLAAIVVEYYNTIDRLYSSTTNMVKGILRAFQPLLKGLRPVMDGISSLVHSVFGTISKVFNAITKSITKVVSAFLKGATPGLRKAFKSLKPLLKGIGKLFSHVGDIIVWLCNHVITPILVPAFKIFGKIIGWLAKIIKVPIDVITACIKGLVWAFDKLKEGLKAIEKPIHDFMTGAGKALGQIGDKIGKFFGVKNGLGLDAKIRNYKSDVSNSMLIKNNDATINVTPTMGQNPEAIAREVARLIRAGAV